MKNKAKQIYAMLSQLSVSGDAVDIVAAIRELLRQMIEEAEDGGQTDKQPASSGKR